jgi:hypothetical protein
VVYDVLEPAESRDGAGAVLQGHRLVRQHLARYPSVHRQPEGRRGRLPAAVLLSAHALTTDLTGLSQNAFNATIYQEDDRLSTRLSGAYRDEYLTTAPGRNGSDVEGTASTFDLDFSLTWSFNDNLHFTLQALNLTDEFQDQWFDSRLDLESFYRHTGRGARFRYNAAEGSACAAGEHGT